MHTHIFKQTLFFFFTLCILFGVALQAQLANLPAYSISFTHLPTDIQRLIAQHILYSQSIETACKDIVNLKKSCKQLNAFLKNDFLKKEVDVVFEKLCTAVQKGNLELTKKYAKFFLIHTKRTEDVFFKQDSDGNTLMHHAAQSNAEIVEYLQILYNKYKEKRSVKLFEAIKNNDPKKLKELLKTIHPDSGTRLNMIPNNNGKRPSEITEKYSRRLKFLHSLEHIKLTYQCCFEPRGRRHTGKLRFIGVCPLCNQFQGLKTGTPLMFACAKNNTGAIKLLLNAGANPNIQSSLQIKDFRAFSTALMMTTNSEIIKLLLESGAQPNLKNIYGETALIHCLKAKSITSIKMLLDAGVNVNIRSLPHKIKETRTMTALEFFWEKTNGNPSESDWEILKLLAQKITHQTPFERAILEKNAKKVNEIVKNTESLLQALKEYMLLSKKKFIEPKKLTKKIAEINELLSNQLLAPNLFVEPNDRKNRAHLLLNFLKCHKNFDQKTLLKHFKHLINLGAKDIPTKIKTLRSWSQAPILQNILHIKGEKGVELLKLYIKNNLGTAYFFGDSIQQNKLILEHKIHPDTIRRNRTFLQVMYRCFYRGFSYQTPEELKQTTKLFLEYGADPNLKDPKKKSPLDYARKYAKKTGDNTLVNFILENMKK